MSIEQIGALGVQGLGNAAKGGGGVDAGAFGDALERAIDATNAKMQEADTHTQALAAGHEVSLHDTMLAVEKADLSVRTFVTVKSKALEAYQEVMRMQI